MNINAPKPLERLAPSHTSEAVLQFLNRRRSAMVKCMGGDGPDAKQLAIILRLAARVPDHRKLFPWRFLVFRGKSRAQFGEHLADKFAQDFPNLDECRVQFERNRFLRAPIVIGIVSSPKDCPRGTPIWEQELSAGAVCQNMLLAARASGFAAQWLTEWYAFDPHIAHILGLKGKERMAGFMYIGEQSEDVTERPRPDMVNIVTNWQNLEV